MTDKWPSESGVELEHQFLHLSQDNRAIALALQTIDIIEARLNKLRDQLYYNMDDLKNSAELASD